MHPLARWLFLFMLTPLILTFVAGLVVQLAIAFKLYDPKHEPSHTAESLTPKGTTK